MAKEMEAVSDLLDPREAHERFSSAFCVKTGQLGNPQLPLRLGAVAGFRNVEVIPGDHPLLPCGLANLISGFPSPIGHGQTGYQGNHLEIGSFPSRSMANAAIEGPLAYLAAATQQQQLELEDVKNTIVVREVQNEAHPCAAVNAMDGIFSDAELLVADEATPADDGSGQPELTAIFTESSPEQQEGNQSLLTPEGPDQIADSIQIAPIRVGNPVLGRVLMRTFSEPSLQPQCAKIQQEPSDAADEKNPLGMAVREICITRMSECGPELAEALAKKLEPLDVSEGSIMDRIEWQGHAKQDIQLAGQNFQAPQPLTLGSPRAALAVPGGSPRCLPRIGPQYQVEDLPDVRPRLQALTKEEDDDGYWTCQGAPAESQSKDKEEVPKGEPRVQMAMPVISIPRPRSRLWQPLEENLPFVNMLDLEPEVEPGVSRLASEADREQADHQGEGGNKHGAGGGLVRIGDGLVRPGQGSRGDCADELGEGHGARERDFWLGEQEHGNRGSMDVEEAGRKFEEEPSSSSPSSNTQCNVLVADKAAVNETTTFATADVAAAMIINDPERADMADQRPLVAKSTSSSMPEAIEETKTSGEDVGRRPFRAETPEALSGSVPGSGTNSDMETEAKLGAAAGLDPGLERGWEGGLPADGPGAVDVKSEAEVAGRESAVLNEGTGRENDEPPLDGSSAAESKKLETAKGKGKTKGKKVLGKTGKGVPGLTPEATARWAELELWRASQDRVFAPGKPAAAWTPLEITAFTLGLYIFGKQFRPIQRFLGTKRIGDVIHFYYGEFFSSPARLRWQAGKANKPSARKYVRGSAVVCGWRQKELLRRLAVHMAPQDLPKLSQAAAAFNVGNLSLEGFMGQLRDIVGFRALAESVAVGAGKGDLTSANGDPGRGNNPSVAPPEIPTGAACRALSAREILSFLVGGYRLSKTKAQDLFWEAVWPRLEAKGWTKEGGPGGRGERDRDGKHENWDRWERSGQRGGSGLFLAPGVKEARGAQKGMDFFDSLSTVLDYVAKNPSVLEGAELAQRPVKEGEEDKKGGKGVRAQARKEVEGASIPREWGVGRKRAPMAGRMAARGDRGDGVERRERADGERGERMTLRDRGKTLRGPGDKAQIQKEKEKEKEKGKERRGQREEKKEAAAAKEAENKEADEKEALERKGHGGSFGLGTNWFGQRGLGLILGREGDMKRPVLEGDFELPLDDEEDGLNAMLKAAQFVEWAGQSQEECTGGTHDQTLPEEDVVGVSNDAVPEEKGEERKEGGKDEANEEGLRQAEVDTGSKAAKGRLRRDRRRGGMGQSEEPEGRPPMRRAVSLDRLAELGARMEAREGTERRIVSLTVRAAVGSGFAVGRQSGREVRGRGARGGSLEPPTHSITGRGEVPPGRAEEDAEAGEAEVRYGTGSGSGWEGREAPKSGREQETDIPEEMKHRDDADKQGDSEEIGVEVEHQDGKDRRPGLEDASENPEAALDRLRRGKRTTGRRFPWGGTASVSEGSKESNTEMPARDKSQKAAEEVKGSGEPWLALTAIAHLAGSAESDDGPMETACNGREVSGSEPVDDGKETAGECLGEGWGLGLRLGHVRLRSRSRSPMVRKPSPLGLRHVSSHESLVDLTGCASEEGKGRTEEAEGTKWVKGIEAGDAGNGVQGKNGEMRRSDCDERERAVSFQSGGMQIQKETVGEKIVGSEGTVASPQRHTEFAEQKQARENFRQAGKSIRLQPELVRQQGFRISRRRRSPSIGRPSVDVSVNVSREERDVTASNEMAFFAGPSGTQIIAQATREGRAAEGRAETPASSFSKWVSWKKDSLQVEGTEEEVERTRAELAEGEDNKEVAAFTSRQRLPPKQAEGEGAKGGQESEARLPGADRDTSGQDETRVVAGGFENPRGPSSSEHGTGKEYGAQDEIDSEKPASAVWTSERGLAEGEGLDRRAEAGQIGNGGRERSEKEVGEWRGKQDGGKQVGKGGVEGKGVVKEVGLASTRKKRKSMEVTGELTVEEGKVKDDEGGSRRLTRRAAEEGGEKPGKQPSERHGLKDGERKVEEEEAGIAARLRRKGAEGAGQGAGPKPGAGKMGVVTNLRKALLRAAKVKAEGREKERDKREGSLADAGAPKAVREENVDAASDAERGETKEQMPGLGSEVSRRTKRRGGEEQQWGVGDVEQGERTEEGTSGKQAESQGWASVVGEEMEPGMGLLNSKVVFVRKKRRRVDGMGVGRSRQEGDAAEGGGEDEDTLVKRIRCSVSEEMEVRRVHGKMEGGEEDEEGEAEKGSKEEADNEAGEGLDMSATGGNVSEEKILKWGGKGELKARMGKRLILGKREGKLRFGFGGGPIGGRAEADPDGKSREVKRAGVDGSRPGREKPEPNPFNEGREERLSRKRKRPGLEQSEGGATAEGKPAGRVQGKEWSPAARVSEGGEEAPYETGPRRGKPSSETAEKLTQAHAAMEPGSEAPTDATHSSPRKAAGRPFTQWVNGKLVKVSARGFTWGGRRIKGQGLKYGDEPSPVAETHEESEAGKERQKQKGEVQAAVVEEGEVAEASPLGKRKAIEEAPGGGVPRKRGRPKGSLNKKGRKAGAGIVAKMKKKLGRPRKNPLPEKGSGKEEEEAGEGGEKSRLKWKLKHVLREKRRADESKERVRLRLERREKGELEGQRKVSTVEKNENRRIGASVASTATAAVDLQLLEDEFEVVVERRDGAPRRKPRSPEGWQLAGRRGRSRSGLGMGIRPLDHGLETRVWAASNLLGLAVAEGANINLAPEELPGRGKRSEWPSAAARPAEQARAKGLTDGNCLSREPAPQNSARERRGTSWGFWRIDGASKECLPEALKRGQEGNSRERGAKREERRFQLWVPVSQQFGSTGRRQAVRKARGPSEVALPFWI